MYELIQVSERCYYINCPAKIGIYVADKDHVYLIDSGNDKGAGRKVRQDVRFIPAALRLLLRNIRCWSRLFFLGLSL